ncbi:KH domain-containing, RNA-binding, signal transduction-associated protein 2 isoform X5 [Plutella xylostella]|uniref:KH domain-containing, RNA-binding, signal transduction-associated protein 2 isoform X5 n=1 Tax=Plutella xylostella TaxID=51655 RepID=UPI0020331BBD|nr:KH domain-containing, RNA-binding, signal transduction-associated protein 2 isoform X5 [Plutella xylostella]
MMEAGALPLEVDDEGRALQHQGSSTGSGSSSGTPYYNHKNGEWRGERRMLDITRDKPVKVCVRVVVPVRDHPKFNFVGKLLGPKGNSLKRLQEDTMCKMAVLGRGSMKDRQKEEELRVSGDPKFAHLSDELHVEISAFATPAEAHARIAYALAELRRFLVPDYNDDIRQEQMLEMQILSSVSEQARRLTPPASSHSGSEEALPAAAANKHRLSGAPPTPQAPLGGVMTSPAPAAREFSPPAPAPAPDHLAHHQMGGHGAPALPVGGHGLMMGGGVVQQQHHLLAQNSLLGAAGAGATARKRPLLGGARAAMSPTKRAVMTLLARARAATHKHGPAWPAPHEHTALLPLIRDEFVTGVGVNINLA